MELAPPSPEYTESFAQATKERESADNVIGFEPAFADQVTTIADYIRIRLNHAEGKNLPPQWIPSTTYWLVDNDEFIGETNIRHELTDFLRKTAGHIGYWIRPSKRHQGYGKTILKLALTKAKDLGLQQVLITCDETNEASKKIIELNGGILEGKNDIGEGKPKKILYWITL